MGRRGISLLDPLRGCCCSPPITPTELLLLPPSSDPDEAYELVVGAIGSGPTGRPRNRSRGQLL